MIIDINLSKERKHGFLKTLENLVRWLPLINLVYQFTLVASSFSLILL